MQRTNSMLFANFNQDFTSVIASCQKLCTPHPLSDVFQSGHVKATVSRIATPSAESIL